MRTKFKQWAVDYLKVSKNTFSLENETHEGILTFIKEKPTFLEIGPGKGKFIMNIAKKYPQFNYLIVEINPTVAGICIKNIDINEYKNVKMVADDFYKMVDILPEEAFEGIFLNFSDPWPKKRHKKRRLTSDLFLINYAKILKNGHKIYYKTDNFDFYLYSKANFLNYGYDIEFDSQNYKEDHDFDSLSEFEEKYLLEGIKINKLILNKSKNVKYQVVDESEIID